MSHNKISHLPPDVFNATRQLQYIDLSYNLMSDINASIFNGLSFLRDLDLSHNQLSRDEFIEMLAEIPLHNELQLNLTGNHFRLLNITALLNFRHVELAGNWWSCKWLVQEMMRMPKSINFGQTYAVHTEWSLSLLETNGIDCYDEDRKRSIIILDTSQLWEQRMELIASEVSFMSEHERYLGRPF